MSTQAIATRDDAVGYVERVAIWKALNDAQRSALQWVAKLGSGCKVNASTARALERRGLVETHENSFTGQTSARATEVGRKVAEQHTTGGER